MITKKGKIRSQSRSWNSIIPALLEGRSARTMWSILYRHRQIAIGLLLVGCSRSSPERRNLIVLVDYSGSVASDQLARYAETIVHDGLETFGEYDALSIYPIDAGAVTRNERLAAIDLEQQESFSRAGDGVTHGADSIRARVGAFLHAVSDSIYHLVETGRDQRKQYAGKTDILGALESTASQIERAQPDNGWKGKWNASLGHPSLRTTNIVLICSDMINESAEVDFEASDPEEAVADSLITVLRHEGKLPDLKGTVVFVTGRTGHDTHQVETVRRFWMKYFQATGADLRSYDFDAGPRLRQFLVSRVPPRTR